MKSTENLKDLEVLNKNLRELPEIRGIKIGVKEYKLKAFADDLVLTAEDPQSSVQGALVKIDEFGQVAGFKLNKIKLKC